MTRYVEIRIDIAKCTTGLAMEAAVSGVGAVPVLALERLTPWDAEWDSVKLNVCNRAAPSSSPE